MRIRYIKPDFFKDEHIAELNHFQRLLYVGLWCMADKEGRLEDRPKRIQVELFPYEKTDIETGLKKLEEKPFIQRYEVEGNAYIQILKWAEHQRPHHTEKESVIPKPLTTPMGNGEGDGKAERRELEKSNGEQPVKTRLLFVFEDIWAKYPNKDGKKRI